MYSSNISEIMKCLTYLLYFIFFLGVQNLFNTSSSSAEKSRKIYGGRFFDRHNTGNLKVVTQTWSDTEKLEYYCTLSFKSKLALVTKSLSVCMLAGLMLCLIAFGIFNIVFFTAQGKTEADMEKFQWLRFVITCYRISHM